VQAINSVAIVAVIVVAAPLKYLAVQPKLELAALSELAQQNLNFHPFEKVVVIAHGEEHSVRHQDYLD